MDRGPTFSEENPAAQIVADNSLVADTAAFARVVARRNELGDKIRFGVIALNAGSIIGLATLLSSKMNASVWMQLDMPHARLSIACFIGGVIAAGIAAWLEHQNLVGEAADAFQRATAARSVAAVQALVITPGAEAIREQAIKDYHDAPLVDFQASYGAIWLQNIGAAGWLAGAAIVAGHLLGFIA